MGDSATGLTQGAASAGTSPPPASTRSDVPASSPVRALLAAAAGLLILALGYAVALDGTRAGVLISYAGQAAADLFAGVAAFIAARRVGGRERVAWQGVSVALAIMAAGAVVGAVVDLGWDHPIQAPSVLDIADGISLPFTIISATAILSSYLQMVRLRTVLDAGIVVSSLLFVGWVVALGHIATNRPAATLIDVLGVVACVGYLTIVTLVLFRTDAPHRAPLWMLAAGLLAIMASDFSSSYAEVQGVAYRAGNIADVGWISGTVFVGLAALYVRPLLPHRGRSRRSNTEALALYAGVGGASLASVWWTMRWGQLDTMLTWNAIVVLSLLLTRQFLGTRENTALTSALRASEGRFRGLVQHSSDVIGIVAADGTLVYVSPSLQHVLGIHPDAYVGRSLGDVVHGDERPTILAQLRALAGTGETGAPLSFRLKSISGAWRHIEAVPTDLLADESIAGITLNMRDITERVELEDQLRHQTLHDPLTRLANRALLHDRVGQALIRAARDHHDVALLFIDLDDFKTVNDSLGHNIGDMLLRAVAERLIPCLRPADTAARLGGDEFAVLIEECGPAEVIAIAERIMSTVAEPLQLDATRLHVRASIGVATSDGSDGADHLLRRADVAMYQAKARGKGGYAIFDPDMERGVKERLVFEEEMEHALLNDALVLYYQPVVDLATGVMVGTEALVRWRHPEEGLLPPARFIALAEQTGWIVPIGRWVLKEACKRAMSWRRPGTISFAVSVNVSALHVLDDQFIEDVTGALEESGLYPNELVVEVTESALLADLDTAHDRLAQLKKLGVAIALDDFGTGYSSLGHLRDLPVDILKIDRSFLQKLGTDERATEFVKAIQALGESLSLTTVAEGVEELHQLRLLRDMHVDHAQGFYFSHPVEAARIDILRDGPAFSVAGGSTPA